MSTNSELVAKSAQVSCAMQGKQDIVEIKVTF